jgi:hypothetical protein
VLCYTCRDRNYLETRIKIRRQPRAWAVTWPDAGTPVSGTGFRPHRIFNFAVIAPSRQQRPEEMADPGHSSGQPRKHSADRLTQPRGVGTSARPNALLGHNHDATAARRARLSWALALGPGSLEIGPTAGLILIRHAAAITTHLGRSTNAL